jgi:uncharacterized protein with PhoU and TrkA domain
MLKEYLLQLLYWIADKLDDTRKEELAQYDAKKKALIRLRQVKEQELQASLVELAKVNQQIEEGSQAIEQLKTKRDGLDADLRRLHDENETKRNALHNRSAADVLRGDL